MINTPILSCDSHVSEPEDLWTSHLPEEDLFRSPAYGRIKDDKKLFKANGKIISVTDEYRRYYRDGELVVVNPRVLPDDVVAEPIERDDLEGRLRDMEHDHIYAETLHPNVGLFLYDIEDAAFGMRCAQIYNDYVFERYDSERLIPNALVPVRDVPLAVAEVERAAAKGFRGIELPINAPVTQPYYLSVYEPLWDARRRPWTSHRVSCRQRFGHRLRQPLGALAERRQGPESRHAGDEDGDRRLPGSGLGMWCHDAGADRGGRVRAAPRPASAVHRDRRSLARPADGQHGLRMGRHDDRPRGAAHVLQARRLPGQPVPGRVLRRPVEVSAAAE